MPKILSNVKSVPRAGRSLLRRALHIPGRFTLHVTSVVLQPSSVVFHSSPNSACTEGVLRCWERGCYGSFGDPFAVRVRLFLLLFHILCACDLRHSAAKWSVAPLSTEKHNTKSTFSVSDGPRPLLSTYLASLGWYADDIWLMLQPNMTKITASSISAKWARLQISRMLIFQKQKPRRVLQDRKELFRIRKWKYKLPRVLPKNQLISFPGDLFTKLPS